MHWRSWHHFLGCSRARDFLRESATRLSQEACQFDKAILDCSSGCCWHLRGYWSLVLAQEVIIQYNFALVIQLEGKVHHNFEWEARQSQQCSSLCESQGNIFSKLYWGICICISWLKYFNVWISNMKFIIWRLYVIEVRGNPWLVCLWVSIVFRKIIVNVLINPFLKPNLSTALWRVKNPLSTLGTKTRRIRNVIFTASYCSHVTIHTLINPKPYGPLLPLCALGVPRAWVWVAASAWAHWV